jgi:two-component system, NarL family, response regulator NreC
MTPHVRRYALSVPSDLVTGSGVSQLSVVIVDDHAVLRTGVRVLLDGDPTFRVVAEAQDVPGALEAVRAHQPTLVVLDIHLPGEQSLQAIPRMKQLSPGTRILILTMHDDPLLARHALAAGASGYVLKEAAPQEILRALSDIAAGKSYLQPHLGARLAASEESGQPLDRLTRRELEVLMRIVRGATNRQTAAELHLSVRTIETHRARLQEKLGVSGLLELVAFARAHGLLEP